MENQQLFCKIYKIAQRLVYLDIQQIMEIRDSLNKILILNFKIS